MKPCTKSGLFLHVAAAAVACCIVAGLGCTESSAPDATDTPLPDQVTFNHDIAPIMFARCAACHRPGESAPFSLLSYQDVKQHAEQIKDVTASRFMPPWLPEPGVVKFSHERRLSDRELETLRHWVDTGTPEGDAADLPDLPQWPRGWQLGEPDRIVTLPEPFTLPAEGNDVYRNFVIPSPFTEMRYVKAVEIRPGNPRIVHHAFLRIDRTLASRRLEQEDSEPGFSDMRTSNALSPDGHFLGWTPGKVPFQSEEDMAWRLEPRTDIVLELHMLPTGKPEKILPRIGFFFGDTPPSRIPFVVRLGSEAIDIPAGKKDYTIEDEYELPVDVDVHGIYPHAHYLAKEMQGYAILPDGARRWLIHIKDWDFNWQDEYRYAEPFSLPKGTKLRMEYTYDNSSENIRNQSRPPKRVMFGPKSSDEMGDLWIQVVPRNQRDHAWLEEDFRRKQTEIELLGYAHSIQIDPDDFDKRTSLATSLTSLGRHEEALQHFQIVLDQRPDFAPALTSLGMLHMEQGRLEEAAVHLERAVRLEADGVMFLSLGVVYGQQGKLDQAIRRLEQAVAIEPDLAEAHLNLGFFLSSQGRLERAIHHVQRAIEIVPGMAQAHFVKGTIHRQQGQLDKATDALARAAQLQPGLAPAHYELAGVLLQQGKRAAATAQYQQVVRFQPQNVDAVFELGRLLAAQGELAGAIAHWHRTLKLQSYHAGAHYQLGLMMQRLGRDTDAAQHLRAASLGAPTSLPIQGALAWLLATSQDAAVRDESEALRLAGQCAESKYNRRATFLEALAAAHAELGQLDEAVGLQQRAIEKSIEELCKARR